ncbi:MAG: hypothetical protein ABW217_02895, partial [Polyangiaceae bacterium]
MPSLPRVLALCALLVPWHTSSVRAAEPRAEALVVEVVEVAGDRAYLAPGVDREHSVGKTARIGGRAYRVLAHSTRHIVIGLEGRRLRAKQRGVVALTTHPTRTFAERAAPPALASFAGEWQEPPRPAESQTPKPVPLGVMSDARKSRALLSVEYTRLQPLSGETPAVDRTRLRALLHAELGARLVLDADAYAELWRADDLASRRGRASRPSVNVRQLELGYRGDTLQAGLGRLRYAASTLGMLDGARAAVRVDERWSIAAFGGVVPGALDADFATDAARFGGELTWQGDPAGAPARASLTLHGSRYQGRLDERRVTALAEVYPAFGRLAAHAELNLYDEDNPWGAAPVEIGALGADASIQVGALRFGTTLDLRRPERSRWLAAALPPGYFCVTGVTAGEGAEACIGGDERSAASFTAAWEGELWVLDGGVSAVATTLTAAEQATLFLGYRRRELWDVARVELGASASSGSLLQSAAVNVGIGAALFDDALDLAVYYRPAWLRYRAGGGELLEHGAGTRAWWGVRHDLDLNVSADLV